MRRQSLTPNQRRVYDYFIKKFPNATVTGFEYRQKTHTWFAVVDGVRLEAPKRITSYAPDAPRDDLDHEATPESL